MMGDGSKLCLVMSDSIQDTKDSSKNGLNNNAEDMSMYTPTLNTPSIDDNNTLHEPRTTQPMNHSSSRRKSESQGRGRRLVSINEDSECFTSVIRSTSTSTMSFSPPFSGFQVPEATVVSNSANERKGRGNVNLSFRKAIPIMPRAIAIICLIFNIAIPGTGKSHKIYIPIHWGEQILLFGLTFNIWRCMHIVILFGSLAACSYICTRVNS